MPFLSLRVLITHIKAVSLAWCSGAMNDLLIYSASLLLYQVLAAAEEHRFCAFWRDLLSKTSIEAFKSYLYHGARAYGVCVREVGCLRLR